MEEFAEAVEESAETRLSPRLARVSLRLHGPVFGSSSRFRGS
jgi:hypothetical protein